MLSATIPNFETTPETSEFSLQSHPDEVAKESLVFRGSGKVSETMLVSSSQGGSASSGPNKSLAVSTLMVQLSALSGFLDIKLLEDPLVKFWLRKAVAH